MRYFRRLILKYFGGLRNFLIWSAAVVVTIYFIDTYVFTRDRLESLVLGQKHSEVTKINIETSANLSPPKLPESVESKTPDKPKPPDKSAPSVPKPSSSARPEEPVRVTAKSTPAPPKCGLKESCPTGKYAYFIKSGEGREGSPILCFDGTYILNKDSGKGHRGINLAVIDDKTAKVVEFRSFDTYVEDSSLVRFLKLGVEGSQVIMAATMDEASYNLKDDGREWFSNFGSGLVKKLKFRDAFVIIGQRGLTHGSAIEKISQTSVSHIYATPVEMSGCLSFPLGKLSTVQVKKPQVAEQPSNLQLGEMFANCGVTKPCGADSFPVHLYTGKGNVDGPKICVNGKYVLATGLNDAGRGFNIVVVDPAKKDVVRIGHFDTYSEDSSSLEIFLEMMKEKEILLAVIHDDASKNLKLHAQKLLQALGSGLIDKLTFRDVWAFVGQKGIEGFSSFEQDLRLDFKPPSGRPNQSPSRSVHHFPFCKTALQEHAARLSDHAKQLLNDLGSGMIQNVKFRDTWVFVGQKGISGFGEIEQIEFAGPASSFPKPIDKKMCVPYTLKGSKIKPDPLANKNEKRRKFCTKYDGYGDFCEADRIDDALTPAPLSDKGLEIHRIFKVPIIVIPGMNHNAVRMQLETLLMQPGIKPDMVTVMYDEKFDESAALAELFTFKTSKLSSSTKYGYQVEKAFERVWELHPKASYVIVLEEEVVLAPDFLFFLAQSLDGLDKDETLVGISAFNENGYKGLSTDPTLIYRNELFPGLGFLLKRSFYDSKMKGHMKECCLYRSWDGWLGGHLAGQEMIVPDVSRVYRRPYEGLSEQADFLTELFNRERATNLDTKAKLAHPESVVAAEYEKELDTLLRGATALDTTNVDDCLQARGLGFYVPETKGKTYVIYYKQENLGDHSILRKLCRCFRLFSVPKYQARGLHKGMLRFTYKNNTMMFIGSGSPYYKYMPNQYKPVPLQQKS